MYLILQYHGQMKSLSMPCFGLSIYLSLGRYVNGPTSVSFALTVFSDMIWLFFGAFMTWQSILLDYSFWIDEYRSPALNIDQKWPYLCLVFGFGLMTFRILQIYYRWYKFGESPVESRDNQDVPHA